MLVRHCRRWCSCCVCWRGINQSFSIVKNCIWISRGKERIFPRYINPPERHKCCHSINEVTSECHFLNRHRYFNSAPTKTRFDNIFSSQPNDAPSAAAVQWIPVVGCGYWGTFTIGYEYTASHTRIVYHLSAEDFKVLGHPFRAMKRRLTRKYPI